MAQGYIYVLANSSMPNVVKVGKTNRQPSTRAQELSGVTGVPTPFIVVYEKLFNDCDSAEIAIHELLSQKGCRVSSNREFFNAPVSVVIECIITVSIIDASSQIEDEDEDGFFEDIEDDELDSLEIETEPEMPAWYALWKEAENNFYGVDDHLVDYDEAIKNYKNAISLGCIAGYFGVALCHQRKNNNNKAFEWYKQGANKKNYICYLGMAKLYLLEGNYTNFSKCLSLFVKSATDNHDPLLEVLIPLESQIYFIIYHIICSDLEKLIPATFYDYAAAKKDELCEYHNIYISDAETENDEDFMKTIAWIDRL